jgi:poly-gamma-glutamate capsule biosynthesis protein CapA/YwtB (metallophosphatase superfamily)
MKIFLLSLAGILAVGFRPLSAAPADNPGYRPAYVADKMTFALVGDAIITRKISVFKDPQFLEMIGIIRGADAAFANAEMLFHDYEGYPAAHSGGTWMRAQPELARELAWAGFKLIGLANNHSMDFGTPGLTSTIEAVRAAGLLSAGTGRNLAEAQAPAYLDTDGGRVALIALSSTFADESRAGNQSRDMGGRPGLNPLRYETKYIVSPQSVAALRALAQEANFPLTESQGEVHVLDRVFVAGPSDRVVTTPLPGDLAAVRRSVQDAARQADWVVVSCHSHETGATKEQPAEFLETFARAAIDAGASIVVCHGPHFLRGIELYHGRPIFYSLGNFIFQNETVALLPADMYEDFGLDDDGMPGRLQDQRITASGAEAFPAAAPDWESVLAVPEFRGGRLAGIVLHPVTLGYGEARPRRGRPRLADPIQGRRIIAHLADLSRPYGTKIDYDETRNVGVVRTP